MTKDKKYFVNFGPELLQLLGPNLYTNIYYVLGEIIANAYDADAKMYIFCIILQVTIFALKMMDWVCHIKILIKSFSQLVFLAGILKKIH